MKQQLILFAIFWVGFSSAVEKPGLCAQTSSLYGACVITCGEDSDCKDSQKCCSTGCGQLCQEPVCPKGVSKVECPASLCTYSQCPNARDAICRIDSCGQCKVEYYNQTTWEKVKCTNAGQHLCERMREFGKANPLPGRYVPKCNSEGKFESPQLRGSVLLCVDEETGMPDFKSGVTIGTGQPDCAKKAEKTDCQLAKEKSMAFPAIGRFVTSCKKDGRYEEKQCHGSTGQCWCVDGKGREWFGTRKRGPLDCVKSMCPDGVKKVDSCDPMICAAVTCPGYRKSEVTCRINPCGQCKAEFLDKYKRKVTCQTCENKRAKILGDSGRARIGQLVPQCEKDGNFKVVQCWGSVGQCWCVDRLTGQQVDGTMTRGTPNCKSPLTTLLGFRPTKPEDFRTPVCPNGFPMLMCLRNFCGWSRGCASNAKAKCTVNPCRMCAVEYFDENNKLVDCNGDMSECQLRRADAMSSKNIGLQPVGRFIPECDKDGNYSEVQCWGSTGYCWCVDQKTGVERELTRVRGKPNCTTKTDEKLFVNKTEIKSGRCPTVKPSDTCDKACVNDEDCLGKAKCCEVGCGKTCRDPASEQLACPSGLPFLLCLHHCQLSRCPAHPDAECTADPCLMCKVEFKDSNGNVVNCTENLTPCELQRKSSPALLGSYRAQCESDGRYKSIQCHGSIGYCWCVDKDGHEVNNTRQRVVLNCSDDATQKVLSKCQQMRSKALLSGLLGVKTPQCEGDGRFKEVQTWEGHQWCVDENGIELPGTRMTPGQGTPDCSKACSPVMCMMYCQYGFVKDSRGCEICKCSSAPLKPGLCPTTSSVGLTTSCTEDLDCLGTRKCCDTECRLPVNYVKPGFCPYVKAKRVGDCSSKCTHDSDCNGEEKCCVSGCSRECRRPAKQVCPSGAPLVMCIRNMCDDSTGCLGYPEATCRMNYCGHCSAEFLFPNGTIADCGNDKILKDKHDNTKLCTKQNKTMFFCSPSLCDDKKCTKYPKATCKVPVLSCDCALAFYDKSGKKMDCLTKCQKELGSSHPLPGAFKPMCELDGTYSRKQCHGSTGYCWCASEDGTEWPGTRTRSELDCTNEKQPKVRSILIQLSFDANFDTVKDSVDTFKTVLVGHMKDKFGIHLEQIKDVKITPGSIVVEFVLLEHEDGKDIRNVSSNLRGMVLQGEFVIEFGGETMVAKPESYKVSAMKLDSEDYDERSSGPPVLAIVLGVVFGVLVIVLVIGVLFLVRKRSRENKYRGMSVNTCDSSQPMAEK